MPRPKQEQLGLINADSTNRGLLGAQGFTNLDLLSDQLIQNTAAPYLRPVIPHIVSTASTVMTSNMLYAVYMGYLLKDITIERLLWWQPTAGAGVDNGNQIGIGSTPDASSYATAFANITPLALAVPANPTSTGVKQNTVNMNALVPAGTHLWALIKSLMATTQLSSYSIVGDVTGTVQSKSAVGTLTVGVPVAMNAYQSTAPYMCLRGTT